jgi:hypothetical protein
MSRKSIAIDEVIGKTYIALSASLYRGPQLRMNHLLP